MKKLKVKLARRGVYLDGTKKYWWRIKHKSSSSSEDSTDTRIWYTDSKKHGYVGNDKIKISAIRKLEERQRGEPVDWTPAEHRIKTLEKLAWLNKLVDRAEKEHRRQESKKPKEVRLMKPPSIKRISKTRYEIDWGKNVYRQEMAYDRQMNEITVWKRRKHGNDEWEGESDKDILKLLKKVIAEFKESESKRQKGSEQKEPEPKENSKESSRSKESSKQKRPKLPERNKHGGLIIHSLANDRYYTRFDIRKSKKYPGGFTFRAGRGRLFVQETLDRQSLTALVEEGLRVLRS